MTIEELQHRGVSISHYLVQPEPGRVVGNTTRMVDAIIQELFTDREVAVLDYPPYAENRNANVDVLRKVMDRLRIEHKVPYRGYSRELTNHGNFSSIKLKRHKPENTSS